jgi:chaperone required for assembly of F1-ATPase
MAGIDGAKRFYDRAEVIRQSGSFTVALDGRAIKTPAAADLVLPTEALAEAVAGEWNGQGKTLDAATMPMFRSAATVIDRVAPKRAEVIHVTLKFGETDLLCYRADAPDDLVQQQSALWQPWLDWAASVFGAEMKVTTGIVPINQPAAAIAALTNTTEGLNDYQLLSVSAAAAAAGSLILGLALGQEALSPEEAAALALLDDLYQVERWGDDADAEINRRRVESEIADAARFLELCR